MCCMAAATSSPAARKSLPLSQRDVDDLATLRRSARYRAALAKLSHEPVSEDSSEAALLHALVGAGMRAVSESVEEEGYEAMAADYSIAQRKAFARRRRPTWADE